MRTRATIILGLLLLAGPAPGEEPPVRPATPEQAAEAVLAARAAQDEVGLALLAAKDEPDPWLVADDLLRRGEHEVAAVFAQAAPRVDVEGLPGYVTSQQGKLDDAGRRERLTQSSTALTAQDPTAALEALGPAEPGAIEDVVGVRLAMGRGLALAALGRPDESHAAFLAAAEAAERLGWLARAVPAYQRAGNAAYRGSAYAPAVTAWERWLALCERCGDNSGAAGAIGNIGTVHFAQGAYGKALEVFQRALAAQEALGNSSAGGHAHADPGRPGGALGL